MDAAAAGPAPPAGYVSAEAKRRFTLTAGVLGAVFFALQFLLPFAALMVIMPAFMWTVEFEAADVERSALWDGKLWYVGHSIRLRPPVEESTALRSLVPGGKEGPRTVAPLMAHNPWLLAGEDRLWIITPERVFIYAGGRLTLAAPVPQLGDLSRPFLYEGRPAVIEHRPGGQALRVFEDDQWTRKAAFSLGLPPWARFRPTDLQVVAIGPALHLFARCGDTVYYRAGLPQAGEEALEDWQPVREVRGSWTAAAMGGRPALFCRSPAGAGGEVVGLALEGGQWRPFSSCSCHALAEFAVFPTGERDFVLAQAILPAAFRIVEVKAGSVVSDVRHGGDFPFPRGMMLMMFVPHLGMVLVPVVLAFVLSPLMQRHRVTRHAGEGGEATYAPLWRRALAQAVDAAILGAPFAAAFVAMAVVFADFTLFMEGGRGFPLRFFLPHLFACFGIPWAIAVLLIFAATEGRNGTTPGKLALGIRALGTDLRPCGFGRAFLRNILKFVDGFFNFLVGILVAALTENWQRLGDLAARTVVVMKPAARPPADPVDPT